MVMILNVLRVLLYNRYSGVRLWNGIDSTVRNSQAIGSFKDMYKRHYFKQ